MRHSESQIAADRIKEKFGSTNTLALIVPSGDYESERKLLTALESYDEVDNTLGLSNTRRLTTIISQTHDSRQFSELIDLDYEVAELVYTAYAVNDERLRKRWLTAGVSIECRCLICFKFMYTEVQAGYVTLDGRKDGLHWRFKSTADGCRTPASKRRSIAECWSFEPPRGKR